MEEITTPPPCSEADIPPALPLTKRNMALIGRALAHPERIRILEQFRVCTPHIVQEIVDHSDLAQSTISEHLRILREAQVLFVRKDGPRSWYCMRRSLLRHYADAVRQLADESERILVESGRGAGGPAPE